MAAINTFDPFPTRVVEEYFKPEDLDDVAGRFFNYITATYDYISPDDDDILISTAAGQTYAFNNAYFNWPSSLNGGQLVANQYDPDTINDKKYYLRINNGENAGTYPIFTNSSNAIYIDKTRTYKGLNYFESGISADIVERVITPLRKLNFIDLMNQSIEADFREPYFILIDVSDYADYKYQRSNSYYLGNGKINTTAGAYRFNVPNNSASFQSFLLNNRYENDILYIRSFNNTGFHKIKNNSAFPVGVDKEQNIKVKDSFNDEINPSPWTGFGDPTPNDGTIFAQIIDHRQGNVISPNGKLTGRGAISIDIEEKQEVNYKITITTLPIFVNWAYFIINYLATGTYADLKDQ